MDKSLKDRFKTHLVLEMNNSAGTNKIIMQTEHNNKNTNNKNDNKNKNTHKNYKINLNNNNIKLLKANININKNNQRKLAINFKNIINKKIISERMNNFVAKDSNNISKRFKSLNPKEYVVNNNSKQKIKVNDNKSKNKNHENKNIDNKNNLFEKILKENNNVNFKNVALLKSKLPKLKVNKTGINFK